MPEVSRRQTTMSVDLGDEQVVLERIQAQETLSTPFEIRVDVLSQLGEMDLGPHLGKPVSLRVEQDDELQRHFHGHLIEGEFVREVHKFWRYKLILRPWTYFLSQNRNFAIHQDMTVVDILKKRFEQAGISDVDYSKLSKPRSKRVYCVQYDESDFAFVSRLMEEEGIYYYFDHREDRHVMMLCDAPNSHSNGKPETLSYNRDADRLWQTTALTSDSRHITSEWTEKLRTGTHAKVTVRDWDFTQPQKPLEAVADTEGKHPKDATETYLHPAGFTDPAEGKKLGEIALAAQRANRAIYEGLSQSYSLAVGRLVSLDGFPSGRLNRSYLITTTRHNITAEIHVTGSAAAADGGLDDDDEDEGEYDVWLQAIPGDTPFFAPQVTPRPVVKGLESAIVTGPPGEVIYTDEYGRVKVRFHWDRENTPDPQSTCWIRVSQTGGLGNLILPRIGHEVLIDFLNGDPDRPLVVGRVFNAAHMPIYKLPDDRTVALWRSRTVGQKAALEGTAKPISDGSDKDRKDSESNEIRWEDKAGKEEFFLHANRDMNARVRNNETHKVGNTQTVYVGYDRNKTIDHDEIVKIDGKRDFTLKGNETEIITEGNRKTTLNKGNRSTTLDMGNDELTAKMGNISIKASLGKITMEAMQSIELKVGQSTIKIDQMGVTIKGMMIKDEAQVMHQTKGLMTSTQGSAMMTVKGGITMIN